MRTCRSCPGSVWGKRQWCHRCLEARQHVQARARYRKAKRGVVRPYERDMTPEQACQVFVFHKQVLRERRRRAA